MQLKNEQRLELENLALKRNAMLNQSEMLQMKFDSLGVKYNDLLSSFIGKKNIDDIEDFDIKTGMIKFKEKENG